MPWINLTLRRGAIPKDVQHAMMANLIRSPDVVEEGSGHAARPQHHEGLDAPRWRKTPITTPAVLSIKSHSISLRSASRSTGWMFWPSRV